MSLDYPDYLRIREKSRFLGWVWLVGECGYYAGLLGAGLAFTSGIATVTVGCLWRLLGFDRDLAHDWRYLARCLVAVPLGALVLLGSVYLKGVAWRRSGIHDEVENTG